MKKKRTSLDINKITISDSCLVINELLIIHWHLIHHFSLKVNPYLCSLTE